jgi:hypothetical protein
VEILSKDKYPTMWTEPMGNEKRAHQRCAKKMTETSKTARKPGGKRQLDISFFCQGWGWWWYTGAAPIASLSHVPANILRRATTG